MNEVEAERQRQVQFKLGEKERAKEDRLKEHEQVMQETQHYQQEENDHKEKMKRSQSAQQQDLKSQLESRLTRQRQDLTIDNTNEKLIEEANMQKLQEEMSKGLRVVDHRRKATITKIPPRK